MPKINSNSYPKHGLYSALIRTVTKLLKSCRNLEERQRLSEKLEKLETRLQEKDSDMKLLARRVQIETKNFKQQLLAEQKRTKDALLKLEKARLELSGYRKLDELGVSIIALFLFFFLFGVIKTKT